MNNIIINSNIRRGHEGNDHHAKKCETMRLLSSFDFHVVVGEHLRCDVAAIKAIDGVSTIVGVEVERSARNAMQNVSRNFSCGCKYVLIICPDLATAGAVTRKLMRALPLECRERIGIVTINALRLLRPHKISERESSEEQRKNP